MAVGSWPKAARKKKSTVIQAWKNGGATLVTGFRKNLVSLIIVPSNTRFKSVVIGKALGVQNVTFVTEHYAIYCDEEKKVILRSEKPEHMGDVMWDRMWWDVAKLVCDPFLDC